MSPFESGFFYSANAFEVISFNLHIHYHSQRRKIKFRKLNNFLKIIVSETEFWFHFCFKLCVSCLLAYSLLNSHYEFWNVSSHPAVIFLPCHKQRPGKLRSQMTSGPKEEFWANCLPGSAMLTLIAGHHFILTPFTIQVLYVYITQFREHFTCTLSCNSYNSLESYH